MIGTVVLGIFAMVYSGCLVPNQAKLRKWDKDKELYIANPLKNRKKIIVRNIYPMDDAPIDSSSLEITVDLDGYTKARSKHHIWVRHKKGIELEIPAIEAWGTPGVTPPPGAEF